VTHRLAVDLPYEGRYDVDAAVALLAAHTVPGAEHTDVAARRHTRLMSRDTVPVAVTVSFAEERVRAELAFDDPALDTDRVVADLRWWLDLDADLTEVASVLGTDSTIGPLVTARPGLRVIGEPDIAAAAVTTVLGQQVSVAAGRTFASRLIAAYGAGGPAGLRRFPAPETLAGTDPADLRAVVGLTTTRARTVVAVAAAFADGIGISRDTDPVEARRRLLAIPGVGPWTADYLAVRALGDRDAFPAGDLVLRRALAVTSTAEALAAAEAWSPLRAYAAVHLWTATAYAAPSATSS
jgi:3-methyladenine DNA glycosylase/8-oxoguanine DNA glycosylase